MTSPIEELAEERPLDDIWPEFSEASDEDLIALIKRLRDDYGAFDKKESSK